MISFILLNWNSGEFLKECLESLYSQTSRDFEVIVVDNSSSNWSLEFLSELYRERKIDKLITLDRNYGFAKGMNTGITKAIGSVIVPLNTDVYLEKDFVEKVELFMQIASKDVGMAAIPVYKWEYSKGGSTKTGKLQSVGVSITRRIAPSSWHPSLMSIEELLGCDGSIPILKKSALDKLIAVRGFVYDPAYISYGEDLELYIALRASGYRTRPLLSTHAWHIGSASSEGRLSLIEKPAYLVSYVQINKWRSYVKLNSHDKDIRVFLFCLLEDLYYAVRRNMWLTYIKNYLNLILKPQKEKFTKCNIIYAGDIDSKAAIYLKKHGELPDIIQK